MTPTDLSTVAADQAAIQADLKNLFPGKTGGSGTGTTGTGTGGTTGTGTGGYGTGTGGTTGTRPGRGTTHGTTAPGRSQKPVAITRAMLPITIAVSPYGEAVAHATKSSAA